MFNFDWLDWGGGHVEVMSTLIMVSTCFVQICRNLLFPKVLFRHSYQHHVDLYVVQSTRAISEFVLISLFLL